MSSFSLVSVFAVHDVRHLQRHFLCYQPLQLLHLAVRGYGHCRHALAALYQARPQKAHQGRVPTSKRLFCMLVNACCTGDFQGILFLEELRFTERYTSQVRPWLYLNLSLFLCRKQQNISWCYRASTFLSFKERTIVSLLLLLLWRRTMLCFQNKREWGLALCFCFIIGILRWFSRAFHLCFEPEPFDLKINL